MVAANYCIIIFKWNVCVCRSRDILSDNEARDIIARFVVSRRRTWVVLPGSKTAHMVDVVLARKQLERSVLTGVIGGVIEDMHNTHKAPE